MITVLIVSACTFAGFYCGVLIGRGEGYDEAISEMGGE